MFPNVPKIELMVVGKLRALRHSRRRNDSPAASRGFHRHHVVHQTRNMLTQTGDPTA
jgi:hypothetical protein